MNITMCKERISNSYLPLKYRNKLIYDMEQIKKNNIKTLKKIILFGSCARNEIRVGSDLDLLIITKELVPRDIRGEIASDLEEAKNGITTDVIFYTEDTFNESDCLFVKEIRRDGIILWEET